MPKRKKVTGADDAPIEEFKRLFKAARREHTKAGRLATADNPIHKAALQHAKLHRIPGGEALVTALPAASNGINVAIAVESLNAIREKVPRLLEGHLENLAGILLTKLGQHDAAILCHEKALATPGYDSGLALNNIGINYRAKKEYDRAIESYEKALATPSYDTPGDALNNIGNVYAEKGEFSKALEYYQKALAAPGSSLPGGIANNLGCLYSNMGDHNRAIEYFEKALSTPGYSAAHRCRLNIARNLRELGRLQDALEIVDAVLAEPDVEDRHGDARYLRGIIQEQIAGLKPSATEEALTKPMSGKTEKDSDSPESRIIEKLQGSKVQERDKYDVYLRREGSKRDNVFSCLRGWSSAVTLLEGGKDNQWQGGGYFLKWQGRGIVIDPGLDFLDNFHDSGYNGREIDAVLVSHNHTDHNYDLGSVDDLRYELHRRWKVIPEAERKGLDLGKCLFVIDEDTAKGFRQGSPAHRGAPLKFDLGSYQQQRWLDQCNGLPVKIEHFPAQHGDDVPAAMGIKLCLLGPGGEPELVLGYTGDSSYSDAFADHLRDCDILLAHISMPDAVEYTDDKHLKSIHLGYNGLARLINRAKPRLTLVGEFWAGLADLRIDLTQGLRQRTKNSAILPTGLGFHLHLPTLEVECTCCQKRIPFGNIRVSPASTPFGPLGYLCERCLV